MGGYRWEGRGSGMSQVPRTMDKEAARRWASDSCGGTDFFYTRGNEELSERAGLVGVLEMRGFGPPCLSSPLLGSDHSKALALGIFCLSSGGWSLLVELSRPLSACFRSLLHTRLSFLSHTHSPARFPISSLLLVAF